MPKKLTYEFVRDEFEKRGYILISTEYKGNDKKLDYLCPIHGGQSISYNSLQSGSGCFQCYDDNHRVLFSDVIKAFEDQGYILISKEYINSTSKLTYICPKHGEQHMRYSNMKNGHRCPQCNKDKERVPFEVVNNAFIVKGYILLSTSYQRGKDKLDYLCPKHGKQSISYNDLYGGHGCPDCKRDSLTERYTGENNPSWQGGVTCLNKYLRTQLVPWTQRQLNIANYTCKITGKKGDIHVHHMYSFSNIRDLTLSQLNLPILQTISEYGDNIKILTDTFLENNEILANPIVMHRPIHESFHAFCGGTSKDTSEGQLEKFKEIYLNNLMESA